MKTPQHVVLVDLDEDLPLLLQAPFSEFQRARVPPATGGVVDASRVLVLVSERLVRQSDRALEHIIVSPSTGTVICLIRGSVVAEPRGDEIDLALPAILERAPIACMWVSDPRGVVWSMGSAKAKALTVFAEDPEGARAFELLVDAIRLPEVFDDVFAKAKSTGTLVSPALRLLVPGAADVKLVETAEASAVKALTMGGQPNVELSIDRIPSELESRSQLFGGASAPAEFFDAQGRIGQLARAIDLRRAEVDVAVERLVDRPPLSHAPIAAVHEAVRAVGLALELLKNELKAVFLDVDGSDGLDTTELRKLRTVGLRPGSTKAAAIDDAGDSEAVLRNYALGALRRNFSLQEVVGDLRHVEEQATPRTPKETVAILDAACPDEMIERLKQHAALRITVTDWLSILLLAAISAFAAMMFAGWVVLPLLALAVLGLFFYFVTHPFGDLRALSVEKLKGRLRSKQVYLVTVAVAVGLVVGASVRDLGNTTALHVIGSVMSPVLFFLFARHAWRQSSQRWLAEADLAGAREAGDRMLERTAQVMMNDWILANPRTRFAQTAGRLAAGIEEMRVALHGPLAPGNGAQPGGKRKDAQPAGKGKDGRQPVSHEPVKLDAALRCNPAIRGDLTDEGASALYKHSATLQEIVLQDYLDALSSVIEEQWAHVAAAAEERDAQASCLEALKGRLAWYRRDLKSNGLFGSRTLVERNDELALSAEGRRRRRDLLAELWEGLDLDELVGVMPDTELVQFCSPDDLAYLDQDPASAEMVRFAPTTQKAKPRKSEIIRTSWMQMAGVIRLVPVRSRSVAFASRSELEPDKERVPLSV